MIKKQNNINQAYNEAAANHQTGKNWTTSLKAS